MSDALDPVTDADLDFLAERLEVGVEVVILP